MAPLVTFEAKLMGIMFYSAARIINSKKLTPVRLVRERSNVYDANSVLVTNQEGDHLGHVDRQTAASLSKLIDDYCDLMFVWLVVFCLIILY